MADNKYQLLAQAAAIKHGFDPDVFVRQINQESGFNPNAVSHAGAQGIAQIMPATAQGWGVNPMDPIASLDAAAKNMAAYFQTYVRNGHDPTTATALALAAYNAGPGAVAKAGGVPHYPETQNYVRRIMGGGSFDAGKKSGQPQQQQLSSPQVSIPEYNNPLTGMQMMQLGGAMTPNITPGNLGVAPVNPLEAQSGVAPVASNLPGLMASFQRDSLQQPQTNFWGDVANSTLNQGSFNALNLPHGNGIGAGIGTALGGVANAITGVGLTALTPIAPELTVPAGLGLAGLVGGASREARAQVNQHGHITNPGAIATEGLTNLGLNLIPGSQAEGLIARMGGNALRFGAGSAAASSLGQVARGEGFSPQETLQAGLMGAGMGAGAAFLHTPKPKVGTFENPQVLPALPDNNPVRGLLTGGPAEAEAAMHPEGQTVYAPGRQNLLTGDSGPAGLLTDSQPIRGLLPEAPPVKGLLPQFPDPIATPETSQTLSVPGESRVLVRPTRYGGLYKPGLNGSSVEQSTQGMLIPGLGRTTGQPVRPVPEVMPEASSVDPMAESVPTAPTEPVIPPTDHAAPENTFSRFTAARRYASQLRKAQGLAPDEVVITTIGKEHTVSVVPKEPVTEAQGATTEPTAATPSPSMPPEAPQATAPATAPDEPLTAAFPKQPEPQQPQTAVPPEPNPVPSEKVPLQPASEPTGAEVQQATQKGNTSSLGAALPNGADAATSIGDFVRKFKGVYTGLDKQGQQALNATFEAIRGKYALDIPYRTKTGSTSVVNNKTVTPTHVEVRGNAIRIVGLNEQGQPGRYIVHDFAPNANKEAGLKGVPQRSHKAPVFQQADPAARAVKTADGTLEKQAGAIQKLAQRFPKNPSIQAMAKELAGPLDVAKIQKAVARVKSLSRKEADAFLSELNKRC